MIKIKNLEQAFKWKQKEQLATKNVAQGHGREEW